MAANDDALPVRTGFLGWLNKRLPVDAFIRDQLTGYFAPKNFNFWYFFGVLSLVALVIQLVTGIFLTMHYKVGETTAFDSVQYIMREVPYGWLQRYIAFHGRVGVLHRRLPAHVPRFSFTAPTRPRELLWLFGMFVYLALMAEAFMGYVLPWGNMSFWGAQVIVNLFGTVPVIGPGLVEWIRGDYGIADATLNRFFALHVVAVPLVLLLLVALHLVAPAPERLEQPGRYRDQGKEGSGWQATRWHSVPSLLHAEGSRRHRCIPGWLRVRHVLRADLWRIVPRVANFEPANPLSTPDEIAPVWYFTPYYAILRAVPDQRLGALLMALSIICLVVLPWLDRSPVKSSRYRPLTWKLALAAFVVSFIGLGYLGMQKPEGLYVLLARIFALVYFAFFALMPLYTRGESTSRVPARVTFSSH